MDVLKFQYPVFLHGLWGVVLLILFFVWVSRNKEKLLRQFGHLEMMRKMMPGYSKTRVAWKSALFIMGYIFLITALADPQMGTKLEEVKREGVDIVTALDVSLSMQAEDIAPNRLEKAKHEISKLIDILQGDRIGMVAFAGMAHVQCPLTLDYSAAKLFLRMMDTDLIPQPGTALADAIKKSIKMFNQKERKHKVLILITDGESHEGDVEKAAEEAAKEGIVIYTIGLGSARGVPIPVYDNSGKRAGFKKDRDGNVVTTKLDASILQKIAFLTNGKYYISSGGETELTEIYKEVNKMDKKNLTSKQFTQYEDRYQVFAVIALLFFILEMLIPVRNKKLEVL